MNVGNCSRCGRLFDKRLGKICPECVQEEEQMYEAVYRFVRDNPSSTVDQVHEATEVPKERILQFLREGRLDVAQWVSLEYPCERCGSAITKGRYCERCTLELQSSFKSVAAELKTVRENKGTGYHIDDRSKRRI